MFDAITQGGDPLRLFGIASAVLSIYAFYPYARDVVRGRTQPQRACWLIWSVLGSIALVSQIVEGATESLWFAAIQVGWTVVIFGLAIWRGQGRFLNPGDESILAAAAIGLGLWATTDSAAYALFITISISMLGGAATIAKAYRAPGTETMSTWVISWAASACAICAVGSLDRVLLAYPLYLLCLYTGIILAMAMGRNRGRQVVFSTTRRTAGDLM
ncbi:hypothetical protein [Tateyamaria sp. ANG-S1]|uniref:hypothetical protein n=1 Tax=Tateyamaria sp. ANG-S1 TaxID=1577905 RepID=UPI00057DC8F2|nr:hypothetical protein [Tateyamaria sp. ANG-S1]KIC48103.1 hypothetical protein RA29_18135 [Tateyamaria sp. ANG-S1]